MTLPPDATLALLDAVIQHATKAGADAADAVFIQSVAVSVERRLGKPEGMERSESNDISVRAFCGQRQAIVSSSDLRMGTLQELAERAVTMARAVPEDPYCGLAGPDQITRENPDLELYDPSEPSVDHLIAKADEAESTALAVDGVTNSNGAGATWTRSGVAMAASNGFGGQYQRTSHSLSCSVLAGEGTEMQTDYDYTYSVHADDLRDPKAIGALAAERAIRRLNPRKVGSARVPVVFDPRVSRGLVGSLTSAISGSAIARGTSFLKDRLGQQIMPSSVSILDDPLLGRGLRSRPFDGEGIGGRKRHLVENGMLMTWLLDLRSARQLGLETTGHAARSVGSPPSPSATNVHLSAGDKSPEALIADIDSGFYVTDMMGQGLNMVTGDYSRGATGFWIEKGEIAYPVSEVTVAGNMRDMFLNLTPANDLERRYGIDAPTLVIEGMTVAGR